jgi:threonine synthase
MGTSPRQTLPDLTCSRCERRSPPLTWRCACEGPLDLVEQGAFDPTVLPARQTSLWRYRQALPAVAQQHIVSLGEGFTPLVEARHRPGLTYKLDFLLPTGSFKDRGSSVLASCLRQLEVTRAVEDSSGNAGASMAAYFASAGIGCTVYVPGVTAPGKIRQIRSFGARIVSIAGSRAEVTRAAEAGASEGFYASHQWSPYFLAGVKTIAFELWEQLGGRVPDNLVVPVGSGTLLLGAYLGFRQLYESRLAPGVPRLFGAQAEACSPLVKAMQDGRKSLDGMEVTSRDTVAAGIRVERAPRARQILSAVRDTRGALVAVSEAEIAQAWWVLAKQGLYVEPTSAAASAAAEGLSADGRLGGQETTAVVLTGTGLKGAEVLADAPEPVMLTS